jgi:S-(hydroxymethyl)glutathione dehydrogenase/alcohol dehydrogenase
LKTHAAVLVQLCQPLEMMDLDIPALKQGQVLVRIDFAGVCHTQLLEARGRRGPDVFLPHCLGHEGSGQVLETSKGVERVKTGERVILSWIQASGAQVPGCVYHDASRRPVNAGAITTFMTHAVVSENRLTPLRDDIPLRDAAMLGCAMPTGLGAVLNTGQLTQGQRLVVFGTGGVGLCAIAAGAVARASVILAIDPVAAKRDAAKSVGATHTLDPAGLDESKLIEKIHAIIPGGPDLAVEATGRTSVMARALACVRQRGGKAVIIGNAPQGELLQFDPKQLSLGKQLRGCWGGDAIPDRDYPHYAQLIAQGKINLQPMLTPGYQLSDINRALDDLEQGKAVRPIIQIHGESFQAEAV